MHSWCFMALFTFFKIHLFSPILTFSVVCKCNMELIMHVVVAPYNNKLFKFILHSKLVYNIGIVFCAVGSAFTDYIISYTNLKFPACAHAQQDYYAHEIGDGTTTRSNRCLLAYPVRGAVVRWIPKLAASPLLSGAATGETSASPAELRGLTGRWDPKLLSSLSQRDDINEWMSITYNQNS